MMSGPQFLHIQSYSLKPNPKGQSVAQILEEAGRAPLYSIHVDSPSPPKIIYGLSPGEVEERHKAMVQSRAVEVRLASGKTARRGIRKDRHTLLTAVVSYPLLTNQVAEGSQDRAAYERWIDLNLKWLRAQFGDQLLSVIEHTDEKHPHLHVFVLPLDDPDCMARRLNPAWRVKEEAEKLAKHHGHPAKMAVKLGNRAYRAKARELQDDYYRNVGLPAGLTRTGPKRERLSRAQWKERKASAKREAELLREMDTRVEDLADGQAALDAEVERKAEELAAKLEVAESILEDAERRQRDAEHVAAEIIEQARQTAEEANRNARRELFLRQERLEAELRRHAEAQKAFETEKRHLRAEAIVEVVGVAARVILGVFDGSVGLSDQRKRLRINDQSLAKSVDRLDLGTVLLKIVTTVEAVWSKLTSRLSEADLHVERQKAEDGLRSAIPTTQRGPDFS